MTEKLAGMSLLEQAAQKAITPAEAERAAVRQLVKSARECDEDLTGPDGLLKVITKTVLTTTPAPWRCRCPETGTARSHR